MKLPRISSLRLRTRIFLACAVFILAGILGPALLLPRLIDLEALKTQMSAQVNARLEGELHTDRLEWAWLALPHLTLRNTRFTSEETNLSVPLAKVYPDWWALFRGKIRIGEVVLLDPEIRVTRFPSELSQPPDPELAGLKVVVRNGTLQVAANSQWPELRSKDLTLKALNGSVAANPDAVEFDLSGKPGDGEHLAVSGEYLRTDASYKMKFFCRNFNPQRVFHSFAEGKLEPGDSPLNLSGSIEGRGLEKISGTLEGDSPCVLAYPKDKKILLSCGIIDLNFVKDGDNLLLTLNEFEMREPGLKLAGTVRRSAAGKENSAPVWQIDLKGEDLDLTRIRRVILSMWGKNEIARKIGQIVQGGKAGKASYSFKGTAADLHYTRNMRVAVEEIEASIKIPEGDLHLDKVTGKMQIDKGLLVVDGEEARMGNSRGMNGHLVLGLPDDDFTFKLDVDLDADLAELPDVLKRLVPHQPFQEELAKFSKVSGRASGHLHLGDHLRDFKVALEVAAMRGKGRYAPLAWDFSVEGGGLTIAPPMLQWRNVHGTYGPHVVKKSAGQVRWPDDILLDVTQLDGVLAAKELEKEDLSYFKEISGALQENITRADGRIELRNTTISGKASESKLWKADADVLVRNLAVETPSFPEPILIQEGKGHASNTAITVANATGSIFGESFTLGASLTHQAFTALRGRISLHGKVGQGLGQWLKERQLIALSLFPHLPLRVESLLIDLQEGKTYAKGLIRPEGGIFGTPPKADISLEFTEDGPLKMAAHVYSGKEEATIALDFLDHTKETFLFSWKGELSKHTVDQLLERKNLLQGKIAGDFQLSLPQDPNQVTFSGQLEATDLRWIWEEETGSFVDIQELRLVGGGKGLKVRRLACALNEKESVVINGLVSQVGNGLSLKLDLESPALSRKTLLDFKEALKRFKEKGSTSSPAETLQRTPPWNITGTVAFSVDEFTSGPKAGESKPATLVWQPLQGEIRIHPQWRLSALISNGRLCCLDTTGEWFSTPELGKSHFSLSSACPVPPRFETFLPCLGYPQDIIEGEFALDGRLEGVPDNWQEGHLRIDSHQGRILRMKLLAKIFSVVNITDLFNVGQEGDVSVGSTKGFPYSDLLLKAHVEKNKLIIDEAVVRGEGLNLFARGTMDISTFELDVVVMISPFKTLDAIVSKVPLVGRIIGGETATLVTFPVGVTGKASDPVVTLLPPSAVGEGMLNIIKRTLLLPFHILSPVMPDAATEPEKNP